MSHLWFKKMKCESTHPGTFPSWAVHFSPHFHQDIWSTLGGLVRNLQKCCIRDTWGMFTAYGSPQCRNPDSRKISCWILMKTLFGRQRQLTTLKIIRHVIKHGKMCLRLFGFDWKRLTTGWTKGSHPCENLPFGELLPASSTAGAGQSDFHPMHFRLNRWRWRKIGCPSQNKRLRKAFWPCFSFATQLTKHKTLQGVGIRASQNAGFCGIDCVALTHETKRGTHLDSWIGSLENTEKRTDLTWQWFGIRFSNNWSTIYQLLAVSGVDTRAEQKRITLLHIETIAAYDAIP